jgi:hypothetical protein
MTKIKTMLLGMALALPLAAFGAIGDVGSMEPAAVPPEAQGAQSQYKCCWVFYNGSWYCISYC